MIGARMPVSECLWAKGERGGSNWPLSLPELLARFPESCQPDGRAQGRRVTVRGLRHAAE